MTAKIASHAPHLEVKPATALLTFRERVGKQWKNVERSVPIPGNFEASYGEHSAIASTTLGATALCMAAARGLVVPFAMTGGESDVLEAIEQAEKVAEEGK